ncbi:MAG: hypothetical protein A3G11_02135 [Candidatus Lloydbacteria bacterium RIFCSPLOWO2_12_FULL_51_9]|uniref:ABC transporter ATP-binding protein n=2 Tax=Candidatus Lloydiibacteriota TaxID=1817910 RepID=A0A1G2DUA3_9BACT|nr:MAG: hypothetical protein A3J08_02645 [Candidatus Lloydbacteria bacterium RIFCSPLOWO2_02_FULL_51_11]OGZ17209.1 MAG: hypothetical protein A3G11_02135 [Candidatus Lloydbacteria bacterium RIFCSPLOWO2_12_FULL_51_9]
MHWYTLHLNIRAQLRLFKSAFGEYYAHIAVLTAIGFLSGILEGVGINALIPLFSFITEDDGDNSIVTRTIREIFYFVGVDFTIKYLLIFIAAVFIVKAVILFIGSYIQLRIVQDYTKKMRADLFKKFLYARWSFLLRQKIGHMEKMLSTEVKSVAALLGSVSTLILLTTGLLMYLLVAVNISFSITTIALCTGIIVMVIFQPLVFKTRDVSRATAAQSRENAHFINENVLGIKTVKALTAVASMVTEAECRFEKLRKLGIKLTILNSIFSSFFQPFSIIFILFLFSFSYKTGDFSLPAFAAIIYLIQRIFSNIQNFYMHIQGIFKELPYLEHVTECQEEARRNEEKDIGSNPFVFERALSFKNVSFGYQNHSTTIANISFDIRRNSFVGLIGPSGGGKTTIVDLALRLFEPDAGTIELDGVPVSDIDLTRYRKNIAYVSQDIHLINDTILQNIRFFDDSITDDAIVNAAKQAQIYDTIQAIPQRFNTIVGERGIHFSAGQRQRIVIARALARNPKILILDEATSALDNESEIKIQKTIENLKGKVSVLVIAHRLGTVMNCDVLFVLNNGKVIERGEPKELLKDKNSYFFKMYTMRG